MRVKEAVIVEGRCDKAKLSSLIEGTIVETGGFAIFNDREKLELIRRLAERRGVIILTDSDGAGFLIRSKLSSCLPPEQVKQESRASSWEYLCCLCCFLEFEK